MTEPKVRFVSKEEAEDCDILVCVDWSSPPLLPDNQRGRCGVCGGLVQHRPYAPKKPMKVCMSCARSVIRLQ